MSTFTCKCGEVVRESQELPDTCGVLFDLGTLVALEGEIARSFTELRSADMEDIEDAVSASVNASSFSSTFRCPACGRLAIALGPDRDDWTFFSPDNPENNS